MHILTACGQVFPKKSFMQILKYGGAMHQANVYKVCQRFLHFINWIQLFGFYRLGYWTITADLLAKE